MSVEVTLEAGKALLISKSNSWRRISIQVKGPGTVYYGDDQTELEQMANNGQRGLGLTQATTQPPFKEDVIGPFFLFSQTTTPVEVYSPEKAESASTGGMGGTIQLGVLFMMVARFIFRFVAPAILLFAMTAQPARAQTDQRVFFVGSSVSVFTSESSADFTSAAGRVYIFSVQPNQSLNFYLANTGSSTFNLTETVFTTGSAFASDYSNNKVLWTAASTFLNGLTVTASPQVITMTGNATQFVGVPMCQCSQVAIKLSSANLGTQTISLSLVVTTGGTFPLQTIQGMVPTNGNATAVNPVIVGGIQQSGTTAQPFTVASNGGMLLARPQSTYNGTSTATPTSGYDGAASEISSAQEWLWDNTLAASVPKRSITSFNSTSATAAGNTAVWTTSGVKFRLMCVSVTLSGNATQAAAGSFTIQLEDASTPMPGFIWTVFVPSTAITTQGFLFDEPMNCFYNGFLSSTASNTLNVNLSAALTAGAVTVRAWGSTN